MAAPKKPSGSNYKSDKIWRDALHRAVKRLVTSERTGEKTKALEELADSVVLQGIGGNIPAAKEVGDRLDGRAVQAIEAKGTPVLAIVGSEDHYRPGSSCYIERTVGGSKSIIISGAGHSIAHLGETNESIKTFLRKCCS